MAQCGHHKCLCCEEFFVPQPGQSERHDAARLLDGPAITIEVWADGSTLELFADDGTVVISDLVHAPPDANGVALFHGSETPLVQQFSLHRAQASVHTTTV